MKLILWNIRGVARNNVKSHLLYLLSSYQPDVFVLLEFELSLVLSHLSILENTVFKNFESYFIAAT